MTATVFLSIGYFMYIETSSPRKLGDVAILQSKLYPASCKGRCLHFYYHMYGDQMGSLKVILSPQRGRGIGLWEKSQDMGNEWLLANVRIPPVLSQYMVSHTIREKRNDNIQNERCAFIWRCIWCSRRWTSGELTRGQKLTTKLSLKMHDHTERY